MALQGINHAGIVSPFDSPKNNNLKTSGNGNRENNLPLQRVNTKAVSEYYSQKSFAIEYSSSDGDKVTFSFESVESHRAMMEIGAEGKPEDMEKLISFIKDEYRKMKGELIRSFIKSTGGKVEEVPEISEGKKVEIPEYWNAENTSQRIVDFAVSFYSAFEGAGSEFLSMIKSAIADGFNQAMDSLGELPEEVSGLANDTYNLIMEKLDSWAVEQNITVESVES